VTSWHWRKHAAESGIGGAVASACGRLVDYQLAVGDLAEVDCPECLLFGNAEELLRGFREACKDFDGVVCLERESVNDPACGKCDGCRIGKLLDAVDAGRKN
jgi:hypothetical protein